MIADRGLDLASELAFQPGRALLCNRPGFAIEYFAEPDPVVARDRELEIHEVWP